MIAGDCNAEDSERCLSQFLDEPNEAYIAKAKTCFKSLDKPTCIVLFIINSPLSLQNTVAISS